MRLHVLLVVALLAPGSMPLPAQHVQWTRNGTSAVQLGYGAALVNDMDGDGQPDLAVGVRVPGPVLPYGEVWFMSSRDGSFLPPRLSPAPGEIYNLVNGLGDLDGDGYRDFAILGAYQGQNGIHAISGATHQRLFSIGPPNPSLPGDWAWSIAPEIDVNGDGRPDIVVTAPTEFEPAACNGTGCGGIVYAYSHQGQILHRTFSREIGFVWGPAVARLGDYDGDGCEDYVVGLGETTSAGGAAIVSGRTGLLLYRFVAPQPGDYLGTGIAGCGDLDGDGLPDIAVGGGSFGAPGTVQVFSSRTGQRLYAWYTGQYADHFGWHILGGVDIDQDGVTDVIAPIANLWSLQYPMALLAFSGRDGTQMLRFEDTSGWSARTPSFRLGPVVPPAAGSVFPRFLVLTDDWFDPVSGQRVGKIYMFEGGPAGMQTIGAPCIGTLTATPRIGLRALDANRSRVTLSAAEPGMLSLLVLGASQPTIPQFDLQALGFTGCTLHPAVDQIGVSIPGTVGLGSGYAYHDFQRGMVLGPVPPGFVVYGQWVVLGSGVHWPGGTTAALRWLLR